MVNIILNAMFTLKLIVKCMASILEKENRDKRLD